MYSFFVVVNIVLPKIKQFFSFFFIFTINSKIIQEMVRMSIDYVVAYSFIFSNLQVFLGHLYFYLRPKGCLT